MCTFFLKTLAFKLRFTFKPRQVGLMVVTCNNLMMYMMCLLQELSLENTKSSLVDSIIYRTLDIEEHWGEDRKMTIRI